MVINEPVREVNDSELAGREMKAIFVFVVIPELLRTRGV